MTFLDAPPAPRNATPCAAVRQEQACPSPGVSLRERVLTVARGELGVREDDGANRDKAGRITGYRRLCVRGGDRLYEYPAANRDAWCACFVSWCAWVAARGEDDADLCIEWDPHDREGIDPPIGYRASVAELVADARATSTLRLAHGPEAHLMPERGDALIFGRMVNGTLHNPLHGGEGHVAFFDPPEGQLERSAHDLAGLVRCLGGNQAPDADDPDQREGVVYRVRDFADVLAWIDLGAP